MFPVTTCPHLTRRRPELGAEAAEGGGTSPWSNPDRELASKMRNDCGVQRQWLVPRSDLATGPDGPDAHYNKEYSASLVILGQRSSTRSEGTFGIIWRCACLSGSWGSGHWGGGQGLLPSYSIQSSPPPQPQRSVAPSLRNPVPV